MLMYVLFAVSFRLVDARMACKLNNRIATVLPPLTASILVLRFASISVAWILICTAIFELAVAIGRSSS